MDALLDDAIFHPRSIALVGVPSSGTAPSMRFLTALLDQGYESKHAIYPVNPKADAIRGLTCYPSLLEVPGEVDHVISMIPARAVPTLVEQAIQRGVRSVHLYTAGFSETGDAEMAALERSMVGRLNEAGIRAFGPNCMGLYVPSGQVAFMDGFPKEPGNVMFVSQSGANAADVVRSLGQRGVRFSKVVSFGNGADVRAHHLFEYALRDPQTEVVTAYIEGVQDGRRFFQSVQRLARVKPVILLKGGLTGAGARAAQSHTGSLAGSAQVFDAMCRQAGAWRAETMDDLLDLAVAMGTGLRRAEGRGVALFGAGGGTGVLASDALAAEGLDLPSTPEAAREELREFVPVAGTSVNNPIDMNMSVADNVDRAVKIVAASPDISVVITSAFGRAAATPAATPAAIAPADPGVAGSPEAAPADPAAAREEAVRVAERIARLQAETGRPCVLLLRGLPRDLAELLSQEAYVRGVAAYPSIQRAARALASVVRWREQREGLPEVLASA